MSENLTTINQEYTDWLNTLGFSHSITYNYNLHIRDFFDWLTDQGIEHIVELTKKHITNYYNHLETRPNKRRAGGLSVAHLNKNFDAVNKLMQFLHQLGMDTAPSPTNYHIKEDRQVRINNIQPFTQDQIKELQANIEITYPQLNYTQRERKQEQLKLIFALYYGCGLRRSEGMRLKISDVNFDSKTIFIHQGKNYKDRIVPMSQGVYTVLQDYIYNFRSMQKQVDHERLFVQGVCTIANSLKDLQEITQSDQIRSKQLSFHILRHSIATHLLQNGSDIDNIAQFLGHDSLESTQIYTHIINR